MGNIVHGSNPDSPAMQKLPAGFRFLDSFPVRVFYFCFFLVSHVLSGWRCPDLRRSTSALQRSSTGIWFGRVRPPGHNIGMNQRHHLANLATYFTSFTLVLAVVVYATIRKV